MNLNSLPRRCGWMLAVLTLGFWIAPLAAYAYVGPGAGVGLLGATTGFLVAFFSAIGVVLLWPIRALVKKIRGTKTPDTSADHNDSTDAA